MIRVLCSESELQEYGEVIAVGDRVERLAAARSGPFLGDELDEVEWVLDRYAGYSGDAQAVIRGEVVWIQAVFVRLTREGGGPWVPAPGSARLEVITSTAGTRRVVRGPGPASGRPDGSRPDGRRAREAQEGAECSSGWLLSLADAEIDPVR